MTAAITSYKEVQDLLDAFVASAGVTPGLAPHGVFWHSLTYDQFIAGPVPGVPGYTILVVGHPEESNIILALSGAAGTPFDPNTGTIGQMPQPSPPYNSANPSQTEVISLISDWITNGCPNNGTTV